MGLRRGEEVVVSKGAEKPKHTPKKPAQKTLKERRNEKRAAKKHGRPITPEP
jgi:hypothetical protein